MSHAKINEGTVRKDSEVNELREEILRLKQLLRDHDIIDPHQCMTELGEDKSSSQHHLNKLEESVFSPTRARDNELNVGPIGAKATGEVVKDSSLHILESSQKIHHKDENLKKNLYDNITAQELAMIAAFGENDVPILPSNDIDQESSALLMKTVRTVERLNQCNASNLSMPYNETCRRIVGIFGSILIMIDSFLNSVVASNKPDEESNGGSESAAHTTNRSEDNEHQPLSLPLESHTKNDSEKKLGSAEVVSNTRACTFDHRLIPSKKQTKNKITSKTEMPIKTALTNTNQNKHLHTTKQHNKKSLAALLKKRKALRRETSDSSENGGDECQEEIKLKRQLALARKKKDQKLQLRNWLYEKEQKAENPLDSYIQMFENAERVR